MNISEIREGVKQTIGVQLQKNTITTFGNRYEIIVDNTARWIKRLLHDKDIEIKRLKKEKK